MKSYGLYMIIKLKQLLKSHSATLKKQNAGPIFCHGQCFSTICIAFSLTDFEQLPFDCDR